MRCICIILHKIYKGSPIIQCTMNSMNTPPPHMMGGSSNNMMDSLKSNMMTMLMINNMNGGRSQSGKTGGGSDMFSMMYVFVATSVVDFVFKNAPIIINFFMKKYSDKLENIKKDLSSVTKDITDNKVKKKTASITVTINVNNHDNILGQALLDFITNNKNTTHVSYVRESFILNQKDVINIDEDIFARMTQSSSADDLGNQGSVSTNMNSGAGSNGGQTAIVQIIEVYSFTKTTDQLRNFLDDIKQKYAINVKNKLGNKRYYFNMHPLMVPMDMDKRKDLSRLPPNFVFVMKHFQTNRKFSNLFGEHIEIIRNRVNFFCKNRKWYDEKGIPYTLGLLLSGAPGTGKTSTIKCLANETNRHICNVNLNNDMTKTQLENLFFNENLNIMNPMTGQAETYCIPLDQRIYVLEDVDCQSDIVMERSLKNQKKSEKEDRDTDKAVLEHYEDKHKVDLSFLLNLLDGVLENPGRIVIMTSNFPDTLDSALIRPGRIDVIAKFRNCSNTTIHQMLEFFYDTRLSEEDADRIRNLKEEIITPAEMSKVMFENFSEIQATIIHMENLSKKKSEPLLFQNITDVIVDEEIHTLSDASEGPDVECKETTKNVQYILSECISVETFLLQNPSPFEKKDENQPNIDEKGETLNYLEFKNSLDDDRRIFNRMLRDTVYVFFDQVLSRFANSNELGKKDKTYYKHFLELYIFKIDSFKNHLQKLKNEYRTIVTSHQELEGMKCDGHSFTVSDIIGYSRELAGFFTSDVMLDTGLKHALVAEKIIENGYGTISTGFSSGGNNNKLNTSSYSSF